MKKEKRPLRKDIIFRVLGQAQNQVKIPLIEEMPLSRVSEAIKKIREGKTKGRVVLKIS